MSWNVPCLPFSTTWALRASTGARGTFEEERELGDRQLGFLDVVAVVEADREDLGRAADRRFERDVDERDAVAGLAGGGARGVERGGAGVEEGAHRRR
jgi:hypothetical protein